MACGLLAGFLLGNSYVPNPEILGGRVNTDTKKCTHMGTDTNMKHTYMYTQPQMTTVLL